jgi:transcriptional regulator with XRE-family HTH domain
MDRRFKALQLDLGERIRKLRRDAGLSQEGLALEAEVDRTYVSQIERGIGNPSLGVLFRLALVLKVEVKALL